MMYCISLSLSSALYIYICACFFQTSMFVAYPLQIHFLIHWHHVILFIDSYLYYDFSAVEASRTMAPSFCNKNCPMFLLHIRLTSWFDEVIPHQFTIFLMGSTSIYHPPYHLGSGFLGSSRIPTSGATPGFKQCPEPWQATHSLGSCLSGRCLTC